MAWWESDPVTSPGQTQGAWWEADPTDSAPLGTAVASAVPASAAPKESPAAAPLMDQVFAGWDEYMANRALGDAIFAIEDTGRAQDVAATAVPGAPAGDMRSALAGFVEAARSDQLGTALTAQQERRARAETVPFSPSTQTMLEAETFGEGFRALAADPGRIAAEIGLRSLPNMAEGVILAAALSPAGPLGIATGIGTGSGRAEYRAAIFEGLAEAGVDVTDPTSLAAAVQDAELMSAVRQRALTRAGIIGSVDAATGGLATRTLSPFQGPLARELTNVLAQSGVQAAGGATGEALAQLATEETPEGGTLFDRLHPGEILAEAVGEFVTAPVEVATATATGVRETARGARPSATPTAGTPAPLGEELAAALPDFDVESMMGAPTPVEPEVTPQPPAEATAAVESDRRIGTERREDAAERRRVADMTPEEMRAALLTHELTGIGNRRAYEEAEKLPAQTSIDVDSLKWVNDELGHEAGDELLRTVAAALAEETEQAFHISGDEFVVQAATPEEADALMQRVSERLSEAVIEVTLPDGETITVPGLGVSYGIGANLSEADTQLQAHKAAREQAGLRAARGEEPPGTTRRSGGRGPVEVEGREVEDQLAAEGIEVVEGEAAERAFEEASERVELGEDVALDEDAPRRSFRTMAERAAQMREQDGLTPEKLQERIEAEQVEHFDREMVEGSRRAGREEAERRGLTEAVDALLRDAENAPEIIYVADLAGFDQDARRRMSLSRGRRLRGAYDPKTNAVYIVSEAHDSPADAAWTVAHEIAGHAGFQGLVTRGLLTPEARQALVSARRLARQNPTIDRLATEIASRRSALRSERAVRQEQAAEEAIAELAAAVRTGNYGRIAERYGVTIPEAQRATLRGAIERFVQRVKQLLERMLGREGAFTDAQVWDLVEGAWRYVREGAPREPEAGPASVALSEDAPSERRASPERRAEPRGEDRRAERAAADTEKMAGAAYVPMYQGGKRAPLTGQAVALGAGQRRRTVEPAREEPIRREHIMDLLQREFGMVVYQGKPFKFRQALGFFRPKNFEVRIKNKNDLEVTAHEVFHWIDRTYPEIRKLYHEPRFSEQLRSVSYDATKLHEGFAEFGRLYMTQEPEAIARTPEFYDAFVDTARKLGILGKLERVQRLMHEWYNQGAEARAKSKIGQQKAPLGERLTAAADGWSDKAIASAVDRFQAAKVIERETTGGIAEDAAFSPYKSIRLLAGARSTINAFLNYGTLGWTQQGDLAFTGKGLKHVFEPVADVMDETLSYFVGRRAAELRQHGKENLFAADEINALLDRGRRSPKRAEIEEAFREYQRYTRRLLNFAQQSGILSAETRALWESMYQNYVPFYRVADKLGGIDQRMTGTASLFKRLKGGTANVRDVWENITLNTSLIVHASLKNVAKRQLFAALEQSPVGQRYAVRIPTDTAVRQVAMEQVERVLKQLADEADAKASRGLVDAVEAAQIAQLARALANRDPDLGSMPITDIQDQATFYFSGQPPSIPDKDSVLVKGKRVWYQIGDPLLWEMLTELNYHKPLGLTEQILGIAKRTLTRGVTVTPDFQIANIIRDTFNAFTMSRGNQLPVIDALRALPDIWRESEDYQLYLANGGGFGNVIGDEAKRVRTRLKGTGVTLRGILDTPAAIADVWDKWGQSFELATRLAEAKKIRKQGQSWREAAYQGREVSSDFALHGNAALARWAMISIGFFNARLQGLYRMERELFERQGRQSWRGERMLAYSMRALTGLTMPSILIYLLMNRDDEDYEALPEEVKSLYTVIPAPDGGVYLVPRPFETGALFQEVPIRMLEYMLDGQDDKRLADAFKFMVTETFAFSPFPQLVQPPLDVMRNQRWNGLPVVPRSLQDVEPEEQFQAWTPKTYREVGKRFGVSPLKLQTLVDGYFGTVSSYVVAATDALVTATTDTGEEPTARASDYPVLRRLMREQPYRTTSYERAFYEMLDAVTIVANTARKMRREARGDDLEEYLGQTEREILFGLEGVTRRVADRASEINAMMRRIQDDPVMTAEQKRQELDELQAEQNRLFREVTGLLTTDSLKEMIKALEQGAP